MSDSNVPPPIGEESEDALTRMVREGVHPTNTRERLEVMGAKLTGHAPLGVTAKDIRVRKALAGSGELLALIRNGLLGGLFFLLGLACLLLGVIGGLSALLLGMGAVSTVLGFVLLRSATRAWRNLKAISRA